MSNAFDNALQYVRRIKNPAKRRYANEYLAYLTGNRSAAPIWRGSYMTGQAVRLQLEHLGQLQIPQTGEDLAGLAKIKAAEPLRPAKEQKPCDIGLFSDDANQIDLIEMLMDPLDC